MELNNYEKAVNEILTKTYISKNIIRNYFGASSETANEIFDMCKIHEESNMPFDPRPHRVMVKSLLKVMNLDYGLIKKQYQELMKFKENENDK